MELLWLFASWEIGKIKQLSSMMEFGEIGEVGKCALKAIIFHKPVDSLKIFIWVIIVP